ncbi:hypothetical protein [Oceanobacter kriegii]|uniref:hypothetical protein n=1 Tax=Oceanobacter kriegii TaxID=64972 RepID=UPI000489280A|nr:hypothetical protein [Oceanobacter kriegii]
MTRESSVNELLDDVDELLASIHSVYEEATEREEISKVARPKVKSCLEQLRSCLDYIAMDLFEQTAPSRSTRDVYFPYGKNKSTFISALNKRLPGLDDRLKAKVESIQPHQCGSKWLLQLCRLTNDNKHKDLQEQNRQNSPGSMTVLGNGAAAVSGSGTIYLGGAIINGKKLPEGYKLDAETSVSDLQEGHSVPVARKYEWVKFVVKGTDIDVLDLLRTSCDNIRAFSNDIYS